MGTPNIIYEETFKIRASEINGEQKATLPAICNLLQEVAGNHAKELEFDITDLHKEELTWVLHRLNVVMDRLPDWRETITIKTWPSSGDGLRAYRDFIILGEKGKTIGKCLSYWLMMNIRNRRPSRIPEEILQMAPTDTDHVLQVNKIDFPTLEASLDSQRFTVRKTDLDLNRHVNNVHYIAWALSCLPDEVCVNQIDITFLAEAILGDTVIAEVQEHSNDEASYFHQLHNEDGQKVLAKAISGVK
ncbi:MAG: acyl-[acyl-carrier-protein] thioesterase [Bacteroidota bacterium]